VKFLLFSLLIGSLFASDSRYFLENDRALFVNPAFISTSPDQVSLRSNGEMTFKDGDFFAGLLKDDSIMAGMVDGYLGISATIAPKNAEGIGPWSAKVGFNMEEYSFYLGGSDSKDISFTPIIGFKSDFYEGVLFGEYEGELISVPHYSFLVGYAKSFKGMIGSVVYAQEEKKKELSLSLIKSWELCDAFYMKAEAEKELFFSSDAKLNLGVEYSMKNIKLELTHDLIAYENNKLIWENFDFLISLKIGI
jgi:hypothetical protein